MKKIFTKPIILIVICFAYTFSCNAQWSTDPNIDNVLNATIAASGPDMTFCTDGHGGAFFAWSQTFTGAYHDVIVNRIDSLGYLRFGDSGKIIKHDTAYYIASNAPNICEDGHGGCYIVYADNGLPGHPLVAQHIDSNGNELWAGSGMQVTEKLKSQYYQAGQVLINDNGNGVMLAFITDIAGSDTCNTCDVGPGGVYAQRLSYANGSRQWGVDGNLIEAGEDVRAPTIIKDGYNGMAVMWSNYSFDGLGHAYQIRMNRLDHNGQLQFTLGSKKLNTIQGIGYGPFYRLMLSTQKNYIAVWTSDAFGYPNVFSQKIDAQGNFLWGSSEIKVRDTIGESDYPDILSDGNDGAYYVWLDGRKVNVATGIFAQHLNSTGGKVWQSQGLQIDSNANNSNSPHIAPDVNNGMKIFWTNAPFNRDYMQQLNKNGIAQLPGIGVAIAAANHYPSHYQQVLPASNNHDIIFLRLNGTGVSFAKRVPLDGVLPLTLISFNAVNKGAINLLNWQTTSEINTSYFSVERSRDGNHFSEIGKVAAKNSVAINNYNYEDAATSNSDVYYRLKETDKDGKVTYSNIINIHQNSNSSLRIFPNPAIKNCTIYFDALADGNAVLKIFDINGKQQNQVLFNTKQSSVTIDVSSFSDGTYFCKLQAAGKVFTQKLIVIK